MLPDNVNTVIINTGNLISSKELKKKAMQSPTEEVFDSACGTFQAWLKTFQEETINESTIVSCINPNAMKVDKADRLDLKISVKIFLQNYSCEDLRTSVLQVMNDLDIHVIDSLILALPALSEEEKFDLEQIKPLWKELESFVHNQKITTIGISDLDTPDLAALYEWTQVKPSVNQVNLESCCVMPPEMTAYARDNDIQLLTHNDPKVLLPSRMLHKMLETALVTHEEWKISWIVRYSVVVKCRGIIQNKGYLIQTVKSS